MGTLGYGNVTMATFADGTAVLTTDDNHSIASEYLGTGSVHVQLNAKFTGHWSQKSLESNI